MKAIFEARSLFKALSPPEQAMIKERRFSGEMTHSEWLALIDRIAAFDRVGDQGRKLAKTLFFVCFLLSILVIVLGLIAQFLPLLIGAAILLAAAFIVFLPLWLSQRSVDVANLLYEYAAPLVAIFREDAKDDSLVRCTFDFSDADTESKFVEEVDVPKEKLGIRTRSRTNHRYRNAWITVAGTMVDGSKMRFDIADYGTIAKSIKRSASGKTKYKSKCKVKRVSRVTLRPDAAYTIGEMPPSQATTVFDRPDGTKAIRTQAVETFANLPALEPPGPQLETFAELTERALSLLSKQPS